MDGIHFLGTAKELVVVDYGKRMKEALDHTHTVIQHSSQALLLGSGIVADSLHFSLVRRPSISIHYFETDKSVDPGRKSDYT